MKKCRRLAGIYGENEGMWNPIKRSQEFIHDKYTPGASGKILMIKLKKR